MSGFQSLSVSHTAVVFAQLGKVSKLNKALPQLLMAKVMERIPMIFMTMPVFACGSNRFRSCEYNIVGCINNCFSKWLTLTISDTFRYPYEKTMAFGGVATGSMKAKDALRVQGIIT